MFGYDYLPLLYLWSHCEGTEQLRKILNKKTSKLFYRFRKNIPKFSFSIYYVSKLLFIMQRYYIFFYALDEPSSFVYSLQYKTEEQGERI